MKIILQGKKVSRNFIKIDEDLTLGDDTEVVVSAQIGGNVLIEARGYYFLLNGHELNEAIVAAINFPDRSTVITEPEKVEEKADAE